MNTKNQHNFIVKQILIFLFESRSWSHLPDCLLNTIKGALLFLANQLKLSPYLLSNPCTKLGVRIRALPKTHACVRRVALPQKPGVGCAPLFPVSKTMMFLSAQSPCSSPSISSSAKVVVAQHDCAINRRRRSVLFAFTFSPPQHSR